MRDSFSFLSKLLALTSSSNKNEKAAAQQKLEQLLKKYGITLNQLEERVKEGIEDPETNEGYYSKQHHLKIQPFDDAQLDDTMSLIELINEDKWN